MIPLPTRTTPSVQLVLPSCRHPAHPSSVEQPPTASSLGLQLLPATPSVTPPDQACLSASPSWIEHPGSAWNRSDSLPERGRPNKASSLPRRGDGRRLRWKTTRTDIKIQIPRGSHRRRSGFARLSDHVQTGVYSRPNLQPSNITPAAPESLLHPVIPCSYILGEAQKPGNRRAPESYTPVLQQQENPAKKPCPASLLTACLLACVCGLP